jgi:hypothetical protein
MVENPDDEPSAWRVRPLETQANPSGILVGFSAVVRWGEHVYALGSQNPVKSHPIYAVRWPVEEVRRGNIVRPEWWAGERLGWIPDSSSAQRWPLFENGQSELTVHWDHATQRFLGVQSLGFRLLRCSDAGSAGADGPMVDSAVGLPSTGILPAAR